VPIISKSVLENTQLASGYRIKLNYVFDDGINKSIKCRGLDVSSANQYLISKESQVLSSKKQQDLDIQIQNDSDAPTNDTNQIEIYKAWMFKGYNSSDPIESYVYLVKVADKVIALGLTLQQLADAFNESLETIQLVLNKWNYLKANKDTLSAYKAVKDGM
jgi:hypothetical protein